MKYSDLVARAVNINGVINAPDAEVGVFAGINRFNYKDRTATNAAKRTKEKLEFGIRTPSDMKAADSIEELLNKLNFEPVE